MSEWKKVKLGEILDFFNGKAIKVGEGSIPIYGSNGIIGNTNQSLYCNAIIIGRVGAYCGSVAFCNKDFWASDNTIVVKPKDDNNIPFCYYLLSTMDLNRFAGGAAQPLLTQTTLKSLETFFPSVTTQHRIATILSRYDTLIENYQKQIKLLEEAAQRLYKEWLVELRFPGHENTKMVDGLPEGWERKKLVDMVDVQYGYAFDGMKFNSDGDGMPILRIRNIPDGTTSDFTTEEAPANYIVHSGDIVVGMDGIFHINSWSGGDAYLVQRACSFRPKEEGIKGFIFQAIQEPIKFFEKTLVGATVAHLGKKHIDSIELVVPNNHKFFEAFQTMYIKRQGLLSQIRLLTEARDRLLPRLMGGEIIN